VPGINGFIAWGRNGTCGGATEILLGRKAGLFYPLILSPARLEGMWNEALDMASASKSSSLYTSHLTQDRYAILSTLAAIRDPFNRTAAARQRRSGIDVRRSVHALHGTERVSMPSSGEIRTVELTRGRETGAAILPYAPWHFLYFFPLPHGQGSLRPTLSSL
jgi:hypothetical protein